MTDKIDIVLKSQERMEREILGLAKRQADLFEMVVDMKGQVFHMPAMMDSKIMESKQKCLIYQRAVEKGVDEITGVHDMTGYRKRIAKDDELVSQDAITKRIKLTPTQITLMKYLGGAILFALSYLLGVKLPF
jgi:hypothetical protein